MLPIRPAAAHFVTVFGSTRNRSATSPGVSRRSSVFIRSVTPLGCLGLKPRGDLGHGEFVVPLIILGGG